MWNVAAAVLVCGVLPVLWIAVRGSLIDGAIALQITGVLAAFTLLLLSEGLADPSLVDPALLLTMLSIGGGLVFLHFYERWI